MKNKKGTSKNENDINNVFSDELYKNSTVANFATVQMEGNRSVERQVLMNVPIIKNAPISIQFQNID